MTSWCWLCGNKFETDPEGAMSLCSECHDRERSRLRSVAKDALKCGWTLRDWWRGFVGNLQR